MTNDSLHNIVEAIRKGKRFLVTTHVHPDGDAVGSVLAVYHFLRALNKEDILCVIDDPVPRIYRWLPEADRIVRTETLSKRPLVDVVIMLDAACRDRVGKAHELFPPDATCITLDHHLEEHPDGDLIFLEPTASAVGEIVVDLYAAAGLSLSNEAAVCAYVSIATDTGGFRYTNTTPKTHRAAALLLETGIDAADIASRVFDVMSVPKSEILRRVLDRLQRELDGRLAYSVVTAQDMNETNAKTEDVDGLVNFPRNIEGVEVGILFRGLDPESTKISMRSRNTFNCAEFLKPFGGGGHAAAAGANVNLPLGAACSAIIEGVRRELGAKP